MLTEWLHSVQYRVKESTAANYRLKANKHLLPSFGNTDISKITQDDIYLFITDKQNEGLSNRYIPDIVIMLKSVFKYAARLYHVANLLDPHNDEMILQCAKASDTVIIAWGSAGHNSQRVRDRQAELLKQLQPFSDKIKVITDGGTIAYHPLSPNVRENWILKPLTEVYHAEDNNTDGD